MKVVRLNLGCVCFAASLAAQSYTIQTIAGSDFIGDGGAATAAILSQAEGIAVDGPGNIYVADAGNNRVRRISPDGAIHTIAGTGVGGYTGDGGSAIQAQLSHPYGIALDASGNLYVADLGNARVRKVGIDGNISTVAGGGTTTAGGGVEGVNARFTAPRNVAMGSDGSLYISDFGANQVFRMLATGALELMAGSGIAGSFGDGGLATLAGLRSPAGVAVDGNGTLYIADSGNNSIRRVFQGVISSVFTADGPTGVVVGPSGGLYVGGSDYIGTTLRQFASGGAHDLAVDAAGNVFFTTGSLILMATANGGLTTVAGTGASPYYGGDGGPAASARLNAPAGIARNAAGNWYVTDSGNNRIRMITPSGFITTAAGTGQAGSGGDGGPATLAQLNNPRGLAIDAGQNLYIADAANHRVRKIAPSGMITTVIAGLNDPEALAAGDGGDLYVADAGDNRVLKLSASGVVSVAAVTPAPSGLAFNAVNNLLIATGSRIVELKNDGSLVAVADGLNHPNALAVAPTGDLLVADAAGNSIWRASLGGALSLIAGTGTAGYSGDGGPAAQAQLNAPSGIALDDSGVIWVVDTGNNRVRTLTSSGDVGTITGISIVSAASLQPGPIAPNEIVTIFGSGFDPNTVKLSFSGQQSTIFYADAGQINALAPATLSTGTDAEVDISVGGNMQSTTSVQIVDAAPGIFTTANGIGQAAAVNQDGSLNSTSNPAVRGSILSLYATGGGQSLGASVTIGGQTADVLYGGPAPGFPGLMQINARVPALAPPGSIPIILTVGMASSQDGVTVAVK